MAVAEHIADIHSEAASETEAASVAGSRPTVLVIGPTPPPWHGVAVATETVLDACRARAVAFRHLDIADRRGIQHVDQPDLYDVWLFICQWIRLVGMLVSYRPRVVYLSISQSAIGFVRDSFFIGIAKIFGARVVVHLHGGNFRAWYEGRSAALRSYVRWMLKWVATLVILGESFRASFAGIVDPRKLRVVPNGINWPAVDASEVVRPLHVGRRILYLGTLNKAKGFLVLLSAVRTVVQRLPDVQFVFAGAWFRDSDREAAQALMQTSGITGAASFVGEVVGAQKRALYESADVFVFPGIQQEGQPLVVLEAMAAGLPVIFTNRGCLRETVVEGVTGLEAPAGEAVPLAEKLIWLLERPQLMQTMGRNARHRYEQLYSKDRFAENITGLLLEIAGVAR